MIGHRLTVDDIVFEVLARADVHAAIDLTRVAGENLASEHVCHVCGEVGFARCCGAEDGQEFLHSSIIFQSLMACSSDEKLMPTFTILRPSAS